MQESLLESLKRFDDQRPSLPGEHWMTLGLGLWLITRPAPVPAAAPEAN